MGAVISTFGGIIPRASQHRLGVNHATIAHDVKLRNGRLEPWREKSEVTRIPENSKSLYISDPCFLAWDRRVNVAEPHPDWPQMFISGHKEYLEIFNVTYNEEKNCCQPHYSRLGVPAPSTPPSVAPMGDCSRSADARTYVYTYVNQWGDEGAPSPVSDTIVVEDGKAVVVSDFAVPSGEFNITHINLYRTATGFRSLDDRIQKPATDYFYVASVNLPSTSYIDQVEMRHLGLPLDTLDTRMPPYPMEGLVSITGSIRLAGYYGNTIYFSESMQTHNWPLRYELRLDDDIVHMHEHNKRLFITTAKHPYIIDASNPDAENGFPVQKLNVILPDISWVKEGSSIMIPFGVVFSTPFGVVLLSASGEWKCLTARWFGKDEWVRLRPDTARFGFWEGFLFIVTDVASFILDIDANTLADAAEGELTTISDKPDFMKTGDSGQLFLIEDGVVTQWDSGNKKRKFYWESSELLLAGNSPASTPGMAAPSAAPPTAPMWSPTTAKIRTEQTDFTLLTPHRGLEFSRRVASEKPFRLPHMGRHVWYKARFEGTWPVDFFTLGTSQFTIGSGI